MIRARDILAAMLSLSLGAVIGCGGEGSKAHDAGAEPADASALADAGADAAVGQPDAGPTGGGAGPAAETATAAGRLTGPTYQLDFQLGGWSGKQPSAGPTYHLDPEAPIKP